jgi:hypothetical protein
VVAMLFVSVPYTVSAARIGFDAVDPRLEKVARTLGMGPWRVLWHVTLPLAWRSIATRLVLTCARAISEFGAVVILIYCPAADNATRIPRCGARKRAICQTTSVAIPLSAHKSRPNNGHRDRRNGSCFWVMAPRFHEVGDFTQNSHHTMTAVQAELADLLGKDRPGNRSCEAAGHVRRGCRSR